MIGTRHRSSLILFPGLRIVVLAVTLALAPLANQAAEWNIDQLMHELAQTQAGHARFVETKYLAMLEQPLESSGELFYTAPDYLEKRTLKPKPESMVLDHGSLVITRGRREKHVQLQDYPELGAFIDSIRGTLAGDRQVLERTYQLSIEGTAEHWVLELLPRDESMQSVVKSIRIAGAGTAVNSVEINQADGDRSLMLIEELPVP